MQHARRALVQAKGLFGSDAPPADPQSPEQVYLRSTALTQRNLCFCAFWLQLALSLSSAVILVFSILGTPPPAPGQAGVVGLTRSLAFVGVATAFTSTFFAHGFQSLAKKLVANGVVERGWLAANLLRNNMLSLVGLTATVIGLQASVGTLVGKTLATSLQNPYGMAAQQGLVSLDVFTLQASTNTLLAHVVALIFTNVMLGIINKAPVTSAPSTA
ncbi:MAG: hypothetical protein WDW36_001150 [Sanguina aurantia]